ncbi:FAD-dependent monooxygenase [Cerasicoccus arenae]|uniref:FAD-binding monooxygenase n=1 Tax=Cerasicoccus arenae TaxID=424488 RepID=A0A8J3DGK3_9BACT|nr:FAD-dependent monooxygenase [Cerasicoccus arenae]MBK1857004.1 FAD-dependent monooxygenase [Cerasicoccus arenae]GHB90336.1 FAD-binding monooxygenase [Cerasicoccus arenae]
MNDYDVIIVGGGPCGLLSSLLLARYGVTSLVIERHPDISIHPKAMGIMRRTGEIYRQLGLYDRMRAADVSAHGDYDLTVWSKGLSGQILGRTPIVEGAEVYTPCVRFHCPQPHTEAVIARLVNEHQCATLWHYREVTSTEETADGVTVTCVDRATDVEYTVTGRYLIASDGARSPIRERLGIAVDGPGDMGHFINTYFRANYGARLAQRKALLYNALGEDFMEFFVTVNGQDLWLMHHFLEDGESVGEYSESRMVELIKRASGMPDTPVEVISMQPWVMSPKIALAWRKGRHFLVGDSAARLSPSGGLGMNTGLQAVHNLAWKLAAVVKGDAPEALLDSYEAERVDAAKFSSENSNRNFMEIYSIVECALRGDWDRAKEQIGQSRRAGGMLGQDLGVAYTSGAFVDDGTPAPSLADPLNDYTPSGRPGGRAPHLWLTEGKSTLDLFGQGFVLLTGPDGAGWQAALDDSNWPLKGMLSTELHVVDHPDFMTQYGVQSDGAVLVRPDGYVAARVQTLERNGVRELLQSVAKIA